MNSFRCAGLILVFLLSACDGRDEPAPKPKVAEVAPARVEAPAPAEVKPAEVKKPVQAVVAPEVKAPAHDLAPSVPVVPVTAATAAAKAAGRPTRAESEKTAPTGSAPAVASSRKPADSKSVAQSKKVLKETSRKNAKLDLSLPPELADEAKPAAAAAAAAKQRKAILPPMFGGKDGTSGEPFELNGRLLNNEMQLQMRNDNRRDVEGAALDFKFRQ
jgi:type IV secretory pathway VirB10-like protein